MPDLNAKILMGTGNCFIQFFDLRLWKMSIETMSPFFLETPCTYTKVCLNFRLRLILEISFRNKYR